MFLVGLRFLCTCVVHFTVASLLRQSIASTKSPSIPSAVRDLEGFVKPCQTDCLRIAWICFRMQVSHRLYRIQFPSLDLGQEQQLADDLQADSAAICTCVLPHAF